MLPRDEVSVKVWLRHSRAETSQGADTCEADGAEQAGALMPAVAHPGRARAGRRPHAGQGALLAHPGVVLEPDIQGVAGRLGRQARSYEAGEGSLYASCAAASRLEW